MLSGPNSWKKSTICAFNPPSSDDTVTTVVMPITIPKLVNPERSLWLEMASNAMPNVAFAFMLAARVHSARNASTGSSCRLRAGYQPEMIPTALETKIETIT